MVNGGNFIGGSPGVTVPEMIDVQFCYSFCIFFLVQSKKHVPVKEKGLDPKVEQ